MKSFWKRGDGLERGASCAAARAARRVPARAREQDERRPLPAAGPLVPPRPGGAADRGMLVALAAFGGLGYAATGVTHAVTAATHVVAPAQHTAAPHREVGAAAQLGAGAVPRGDVLPQAHDLRRLARRADPRGSRREARPVQGGRRTPPAATTSSASRARTSGSRRRTRGRSIKAKKAKAGFCKS